MPSLKAKKTYPPAAVLTVAAAPVENPSAFKLAKIELSATLSTSPKCPLVPAAILVELQTEIAAVEMARFATTILGAIPRWSMVRAAPFPV